MTRKSLLLIGLASTLSLLTSPLRAETLLGNNYLNTSLGVTFFGEDFLDETFGEGYNFDIILNLNLTESLDLVVGFDYLWADADITGGTSDLHQANTDLSLLYYFMSGENVTPYLKGGVGYIYNDYTVNQAGLTFEVDGTDVSLTLGGGFEIEISEPVVSRVGFDYTFYDNVDIYLLYGMLGYGFSEQSLAAFRLSYDAESEDVKAYLSYIYKM